jgi:hypothetical protein
MAMNVAKHVAVDTVALYVVLTVNLLVYSPFRFTFSNWRFA